MRRTGNPRSGPASLSATRLEFKVRIYPAFFIRGSWGWGRRKPGFDRAAVGATECFGHVHVPRRKGIRRMFITLTWAKLQADGETTEFAGQVKEPGHDAQAHAPVRLEISMSSQRQVAGGHLQLPFGEDGLNLLNLAGRKLHHFRTGMLSLTWSGCCERKGRRAAPSDSLT